MSDKANFTNKRAFLLTQTSLINKKGYHKGAFPCAIPLVSKYSKNWPDGPVFRAYLVYVSMNQDAFLLRTSSFATSAADGASAV